MVRAGPGYDEQRDRGKRLAGTAAREQQQMRMRTGPHRGARPAPHAKHLVRRPDHEVGRARGMRGRLTRCEPGITRSGPLSGVNAKMHHMADSVCQGPASSAVRSRDAAPGGRSRARVPAGSARPDASPARAPDLEAEVVEPDPLGEVLLVKELGVASPGGVAGDADRAGRGHRGPFRSRSGSATTSGMARRFRLRDSTSGP